MDRVKLNVTALKYQLDIVWCISRSRKVSQVRKDFLSIEFANRCNDISSLIPVVVLQCQ